VINVEYHDTELTISSKSGKSNLAEIIEFISQNEISYGKIYSEMPTLNDVFLEITGKALRDL
ncbi:MAG: ABC transporter ATP-binding protein, partial [Oscillospiraceae bacterium]